VRPFASRGGAPSGRDSRAVLVRLVRGGWGGGGAAPARGSGQGGCGPRAAHRGRKGGSACWGAVWGCLGRRWERGRAGPVVWGAGGWVGEERWGVGGPGGDESGEGGAGGVGPERVGAGVSLVHGGEGGGGRWGCGLFRSLVVGGEGGARGGVGGAEGWGGGCGGGGWGGWGGWGGLSGWGVSLSQCDSLPRHL